MKPHPGRADRHRASRMWGAALLALALLGQLAAPRSAAASATTAAGVTHVRAEGSGTVLLHMPVQSILSDPTLDLKLTGGTFAFAGLQTASCSISPGLREVCMEYQAYLFPEATGLFDTPATSSPSPARVAAGPLRVYIVTDGTVEITARFEELDGELDVHASDPVVAELERLPQGCVPESTCTRVFGGAAKNLPGKQFAVSLAYSRRNQNMAGTPVQVGNVTGSNSAQTCVYPGAASRSSSPDPADHPDGCNLNPYPEERGDEPNNIVATASESSQLWVYGWGAWSETLLAPDGPVYLGYHLTQADPVQDSSSWGAIGMWLSLQQHP